MTGYTIIETDYFEKKFKKEIPLEFQERFRRKILSLQNNLFEKGKALGVSFLRELKVDKYRLYYLIYESEIIILLVTVSNKKLQQKTIDAIKDSLPELHQFVSKTNDLNKNG